MPEDNSFAVGHVDDTVAESDHALIVDEELADGAVPGGLYSPCRVSLKVPSDVARDAALQKACQISPTSHAAKEGEGSYGIGEMWKRGRTEELPTQSNSWA